jgi:hypothetical protein
MKITTKDVNTHVMSVSSLNLFDKSPREYREHVLRPVSRNTTYFTKGSAVDCLITEPDEFINQFAIMTINRPSGMLGDICVELAALTKLDPEELVSFDDKFKLAYKTVNYKLTESAVRKKFEDPKNNYKKYYQELIKAGDRKTISTVEHMQATEVVRMLQTDPYTRKYILDMPSSVMIDTYDQMEILFTYRNMECKAYLDRLIVDHASKKIIPIDLKTTGKSVFDFPASYINFGYYRQGAFYTKAVHEWRDTQSDLKDYTIEPFLFIVAEMACVNAPLIYEMSLEDIAIALYTGGELKYSKYPVRGIADLLDDVKWHRDTELWDMSRVNYEAYDRNHAIPLSSFA